MRKMQWAALLMAALLLLGGCHREDPGALTYETMFEKTESSLKEGHLFFAGKVLAVEKKAEQITYYDAPAAVNTFYRVEIEEDYFDLLPDRTFTVAVLGEEEHFANRTALEEGGVYLFDCTLWMQGEEMILLLPTFYNGLPQWEGQFLSFTEGNSRYAVEGTYQEYVEALKDLAKELGYGPKTVMEGAKARLQTAIQKDRAYFEDLKFEEADAAAIQATVQAAQKRLQAAQKLSETKEGVQELFS